MNSQSKNELRGLLRTIIDAMPFILVGVDENSRITLWNRAARNAMDVEVEKALGRDVSDIFLFMKLRLDIVHRAIESRQVQYERCVTDDSSGACRYFDVTVYPVNDDGDPISAGAVIRIEDVGEHVLTEKSEVQLDLGTRTKGLSRNIAHEINNLLSCILQSVQVIRNRLAEEFPKNKSVAAECGTTIESVGEYIKRRDIDSMLEAIADSGSRATKVVSNMVLSDQSDSRSHKPRDIAEKSDRAKKRPKMGC
jgi:PAS domain S-box-containing protein